MIEQINQLKRGSIISESSPYIVNRVSGSNAWLTHFESGEEVQIGMSYLKNYTNSTELINNPILPYEEGEDRVLRGYKIQFECVDMADIRPVNINTIKWLIFNGVKYIVE